MKKQWVIYAIAVALMFTCDAFGEEKLHSWVANALGKIPPKLEKAESLAKQGDMANARVYLVSAQGEWKRIHTNYKGKFDENHPDVVAVRKQFEVVNTKIAQGAAAAPVAETAAVSTSTDGPAINDPLPSTLVYEMKQFDKNQRQGAIEDRYLSALGGA